MKIIETTPYLSYADVTEYVTHAIDILIELAADAERTQDDGEFLSYMTQCAAVFGIWGHLATVFEFPSYATDRQRLVSKISDATLARCRTDEKGVIAVNPGKTQQQFPVIPANAGGVGWLKSLSCRQFIHNKSKKSPHAKLE